LSWGLTEIITPLGWNQSWSSRPGIFTSGAYHELRSASSFVSRYFTHRPYRVFFASDGPISCLHHFSQPAVVQAIFRKTEPYL